MEKQGKVWLVHPCGMAILRPLNARRARVTWPRKRRRAALVDRRVAADVVGTPGRETEVREQALTAALEIDDPEVLEIHLSSRDDFLAGRRDARRRPEGRRYSGTSFAGVGLPNR
jgi:hypothetical protein